MVGIKFAAHARYTHGFLNPCFKISAFLLDVVTWRWAYLPLMTSTRYGHSCGVINYAKILVAGGKENVGSTDNLDSAEILSLDKLEWMVVQGLPEALFRAATLQYDSTVLIIGGNIDSQVRNLVQGL